MLFASDADVGPRYPKLWQRAREITDRAREALRELAELHGVELDSDLPDSEQPAPQSGPTPLWLLAGPTNPTRRRAEELGQVVDRDLNLLDEIIEAVSEKDKLKAYENQFVAEEKAEAQREEAQQYLRMREARKAHDHARAMFDGVNAIHPSARAVLDDADRRALAGMLVELESSISLAQQAWVDDEDVADDEFGDEGGLARLREILPEMRRLLDEVAETAAVAAPPASTPRYRFPIEWSDAPGAFVRRIDIAERRNDPAIARLSSLLELLGAAVFEVETILAWTPMVFDDEDEDSGTKTE